MVKLSALAALILFPLLSYSQAAQVPGHYIQIKQIQGDLDRDGKPERIVVYNTAPDTSATEGVQREVIIYKMKDQEWVAWERSRGAVAGSREGGMMGDPFEDIEVKNGILLVYHFGGSRQKWTITDKYRFQNNRLELIGHKNHFGAPCDYWEEFDFNISTGKVVYSKEYEECETEDSSRVFKRENEVFVYRLKNRPTFKDRRLWELKILTPKYRRELYL